MQELIEQKYQEIVTARTKLANTIVYVACSDCHTMRKTNALDKWPTCNSCTIKRNRTWNGMA